MNEHEILEELELVKTAIKSVLQGGQSFSLSSGGGSRQTSFANYDSLIKRQKELENKLAALRGEAGVVLGAAW
jgi:hypothetical protein